MTQVGIQLYDPSGNPFVRLGQFPNGKSALKISQQGIDVTKALPTQLVFNSEVLSGTFTFPAIASIPGTSNVTATGLFAHNLGYVPSFQTYTTYPNLPSAFIPGFPTVYYGPLLNNALYNDSQFVSSLLYVGVDNVNLYFARSSTNSNSSPEPGSEIDIIYYIFQYGSATS